MRFTAPRAGTYILNFEGTDFDRGRLLARQRSEACRHICCIPSFPWRQSASDLRDRAGMAPVFQRVVLV
ncbi:hypothetical protein ACFQS6_02250 [Xanthomonas populi]|uniref:hypothetical protein n=1 Tax=Xanthomonas populi TaxID=53414 RepID=UPI00142DA77E|nr:hypothetical protein [Xanthomonas populi]